MDSKPFHADTYVGPEHEDEDISLTENVRERSMTIKLKVENTVRWRWIKGESGIEQRQSNSRIIRWSDGSLSLRLGKELFDINRTVDTSAVVPRQHVGSQGSQSQVLTQTDGTHKSHGLTYLVAQHKRSQVLQAEAIITGYLSLRPTGMQSETHRMLVRAVGQKHNKIARLRMVPEPTKDPEREKLELMKLSAKKSRKKQDTVDELGSGRRRRTWRKSDARDMWSDDEEDAAPMGNFEGSEDEIGNSPGRSNRKSRKGKERAEDYQEDDFLVADTSDEEGGGLRGKKSKEGEIEDPLDKLDAEIEQQARRESGADRNTEVGNMDVESEEEDEFKVRRVGGSATRKRPATFDDEEE